MRPAYSAGTDKVAPDSEQFRSPALKFVLEFVLTIKIRFHYDCGMDHSLFDLLTFFTSFHAYALSEVKKISKRNKKYSIPRS